MTQPQTPAQTPTVGRIVHYVARGSADGVFPKICRAAIVTETCPADSDLGIAVINPTGLFFDREVPYSAEAKPGTWHWPEIV
ncbi:hypothetical protein ACIBH1_45830 [Nonomuraea sp. NPDC050663]|uniref:hypothetical protein n=1 Tax=Nonomuraea sp. NPDC050663 TaxID=3364370 RepID=UPI0037A4BD30